MNLIWKLLRRHISVGQLAGFFLADLVGTVIVLCGIQIYSDMAPMLSGSDGLLGNDYIVISKPVKQLGSLMGRSAAHFSESDIDDLKAQPFARNVGEFRSSQYGVYLGLPGVFATDMFFESVPDRFIDVTTDEWRFDRSKRDIPIILPRNYLNLYNFGFAQTKGLPQLSEGVSQSISFDIELSGSGRTEHFKGHVVGFSDRLNTVLVPESFMEWANDRFAPSKSALASRLIVEVENPADESIAAYLQQRGYEVENNEDRGVGRYGYRSYNKHIGDIYTDVEHISAVAEKYRQARKSVAAGLLGATYRSAVQPPYRHAQCRDNAARHSCRIFRQRGLHDSCCGYSGRCFADGLSADDHCRRSAHGSRRNVRFDRHTP